MGLSWGRGWAEAGWAPSSRARRQERRREENGLAGQSLRLRESHWGHRVGGSPRSWHHSDWVRQTSLASRSDMCTVKPSTSGRETSWSLCPESFCPPKPAPDLAAPSLRQARCAAPAKGWRARLRSRLATPAPSSSQLQSRLSPAGPEARPWGSAAPLTLEQWEPDLQVTLTWAMVCGRPASCLDREAPQRSV